MALSAIGGGVGAGFAPASGASTVSETIVRSAASNALIQGIAIVTGLQPKFDWGGVAAAAIGAGVGQGVNESLGLTDSAGKATSTYSGMDKVARASLSGFVAGMTTSLARGGQVSVMHIVTDAFGNALGSSMGGASRTRECGSTSCASSPRKTSRAGICGLGPMTSWLTRLVVHDRWVCAIASNTPPME